MAKGKNGKESKDGKASKGATTSRDEGARTEAATNGKGGTAKATKAPKAAARPTGTMPGPPPPPRDARPAPTEATVPAARPAAEAATAPVVSTPAPASTAPAPRSAPDRLDAVPNGTGRSGTGARRVADATPATTPATISAPAEAAPTDGVVRLLMLPVDVARRVLPENRLPFYLGVGALAVVGIVEWPVALAAGMAWEAVRRRRSS